MRRRERLPLSWLCLFIRRKEVIKSPVCKVNDLKTGTAELRICKALWKVQEESRAAPKAMKPRQTTRCEWQFCVCVMHSHRAWEIRGGLEVSDQRIQWEGELCMEQRVGGAAEKARCGLCLCAKNVPTPISVYVSLLARTLPSSPGLFSGLCCALRP